MSFGSDVEVDVAGVFDFVARYRKYIPIDVYPINSPALSSSMFSSMIFIRINFTFSITSKTLISLYVIVYHYG